MGYDCTLHLIDERAIREELVPRLLGQERPPGEFERLRPDAADLLARTRAALDDQDPRDAANLVCQLAIMFAACSLPNMPARGVAISLWDHIHPDLAADMPYELGESPGTMFAALEARWPELANRWPTSFAGNWCTGVFIPAAQAETALASLRERLSKIDEGDAEEAEPILRVLELASRRGLAYWEATDLDVTSVAEDWLEAEGDWPEVTRWRYPNKILGGGEQMRRGDQLLLALMWKGALIVDLEQWPPTQRHWSCDFLQDAAPAPGGGWGVISRMDEGDDVRFPFWHHAAETLGASEMTAPLVAGGDDWQDAEHILVVGGRTFVAASGRPNTWFDLFEYAEGALRPCDIPRMEAKEGAHLGTATVRLGNGRELLLWTGGGWELIDGAWVCTWPLDFAYDHEVAAIPCGDDGFYLLVNREPYRVLPDRPPERIMTDANNVMGMQPGPEGTLLFSMGHNKQAHIGRIWFPDDGRYIPIRRKNLSGRTGELIMTLHWSEATDHLYAIAGGGILTVPMRIAMGRRKIRPRTRAT